MFGRMMNERVGKIHFVITFIAANCTFYPMHILGVGGTPRRYFEPTAFDYLQHLQGINTFISISAFVMGFAQLLFLGNMFYSLFWGEKGNTQSVASKYLGVDRAITSRPWQFRCGTCSLARTLRILRARHGHRLPPADG
jgi:heme/copper-type cytochrome/quinol oxidase subunit 1